MMDTLSPWIVIPASVLIVISGLLVLTASIGMVRVSSFLPRTHIQAIIYSTALWSLLLASLLLTFNLQDRTFLHEILIGIFIFITSPVSTILLVRSFVLREERASTLDESATASARPTAEPSVAENDRTAASDVASIEAELEMEPEQDQDQDQKNELDKQTTRRPGPPADLPKA
ncbi:multicomponent K+:H+ antiporter subunit G, pH adaptation [Advenella kashmirensis WT001]|uniref:Multicomponent K+:H+ antiporter subunit G, pH adaptation n=1 Tax=Advenella kashmirensis (strain DSM 17095 / LMG 22695 / WT001) TaxID=1036672 RepID=I3UC55_ADVKW|nr:monovalent cation/H(+) antiporter subunit G [Advenella kashmirensis]AFK62593.1 multicomponent K+:H+ antiporter subunit G, pH adaptation [Advenella kashmirensis WT001]